MSIAAGTPAIERIFAIPDLISSVAMGIQIAHFAGAKTLEGFDFKFQPSVDQKLVKDAHAGSGRASDSGVAVACG